MRKAKHNHDDPDMSGGKPVQTSSPLVIAHRGFSAVAPENTMLAFRKAREAGADGIEIDVHLTQDGEAVVIHDDRVNRTTNGTGNVRDYSWDALQQLDAGGWFGVEATGERIPSFRQVCEFCADWGGWLNVELKTHPFPYPGIEQAVWQLIQEYGISKQVFISSFNHYSLKRFHALAPDIPTAPLYSTMLYEPWEYAKGFGASGLHPAHRAINEEIIAGAHQAGVAVRPWTVDEPGDLQRMYDLGVDAVITNRPDRALELLGR